MNNDELGHQTCAAIASTGVSRKDVCSDEFRMKPAPALSRC